MNTASVAAFDGQIGQVAYSATKGAVVSFLVARIFFCLLKSKISLLSLISFPLPSSDRDVSTRST